MKKVLVIGVVGAAVAFAAYKYSQSRREQSLWAEATADTWLPVEEQEAGQAESGEAGSTESAGSQAAS